MICILLKIMFTMMRNMKMLDISILEIVFMFLMMILKRNMRCHKIRIFCDAPNPPQIQILRSNRQRKQSTNYPFDEYVTLTYGGEPECYHEALENEENKNWLDAMQDEIKSLHDNHTFELVKLTKGKNALENRWIYG